MGDETTQSIKPEEERQQDVRGTVARVVATTPPRPSGATSPSDQQDESEFRGIADAARDLAQPGLSAEAFAERWLTFQHLNAGSEKSALLRASGQTLEVRAAQPALRGVENWLSEAQRLSPGLLNRRTPMSVQRLDAARWLMLMGTVIDGQPHVLASVMVGEQGLANARQRLEVGRSWIAAREARHDAAEERAGHDVIAASIECATEVGAAEGFEESAVALVNAVSRRFGAQRTGLVWQKSAGLPGHGRGRKSRAGEKLVALSDAAVIDRQSDLARLWTDAAVEAMDQQDAVIHPAAEDDPRLTRAHQALVDESHARLALSLPIFNADLECDGALVLTFGPTESPDGNGQPRPGEPRERVPVHALGMTLQAVAPVLRSRYRLEAPWHQRARALAAQSARALVGRQHTALRAGILAVAGLLLLSLLIRPVYRVPALGRAEPIQQHVMAAAFDGTLIESNVLPGDRVEAGVTVLARLDTADLRLRRAEALAAWQVAEAETTAARSAREPDVAARQALLAARERARLDLYDQQIAAANLVAPISGTVISGDPSDRVNGSVATGQELFVIAPDGGLRVRSALPQRDVRFVAVGQTASFIADAAPDRPVAAKVISVSPAVDDLDGTPVVWVIAELSEGVDDAQSAAARPGAVGRLEIDTPRRSLLWRGTRRVREWIQLGRPGASPSAIGGSS